MKIEFVGGSRDGSELEIEDDSEQADMLISGVPVQLIGIKEVEEEIIVCTEIELYEMRELGKLQFVGWKE